MESEGIVVELSEFWKISTYTMVDGLSDYKEPAIMDVDPSKA